MTHFQAPARLAHFGLYPALVVDIVDPERLGRVKLRFPALDDGTAFVWARLMSPYAENGQGFQIMPSVDTEVIAAFEAGDPARAYVVGAVWNGRETMPEQPQVANNIRSWVTRSGSRLEFDDSDSSPKITLSMRSGHSLEMDESAQRVTLKSGGGCVVVLDAANVTITANASVTVNASTIDLNAPVVNCAGHVNCTSITTSTITSATYSPGAGNIW